MTDLAYAPPPFFNANGQRVVFVDFKHARYRLEFDASARHASAYSEIEFNAELPGLAAISMNQPVISACLDGCDTKMVDQYSPDGTASFMVVSEPVSAGSHFLTIKSRLTEPGPMGYPITWLSDGAGLECVFNMSDIRRDGGFLESYLPSNYNFDHFRMSFSIVVDNAELHHSIFSNGAVSRSRSGVWRIEFPSFFTSSCPWLHLGPTTKFQSRRHKFSSCDGRTIPIVVYTRLNMGSSTLLKRFVKKTKKYLQDLESDFGPFPHGAITIFARGKGPGGMEYAGATSTGLKSLRHELDHSYFATSVIPCDGDAGWIDEAIAKWGDAGYFRSKRPPSRRANIGRRSPYIRTTSRESYGVGRDFLAHLDYVVRKQGGLKEFLSMYARQKRHQSVTAVEFQILVEDFYGASLQKLFENYVYFEQSGPQQFT